jgi:peptidoglycan/LPS O-acetylase OafA/YrhL
MGMISYSFYLLHYPILRALHHHPDLLIRWPGHDLASGILTATVIVLPLSIAAAMLVYFVIERPPLAMRRQYATFKPVRSEPADHQPPVAAGSDA